MGAGNFVLASTDVCACLESLPDFKLCPLVGNVNTSKQGASFVGTIGRLKVYRDIFSMEDYAVVGYKGTGVNDAGIVYSPYVPVMFDEAKGQESFHTHMGVMTRYAITDHMFGSQNYYRYINVVGLGNGSLVDSVPNTSANVGNDYETQIDPKDRPSGSFP